MKLSSLLFALFFFCPTFLFSQKTAEVVNSANEKDTIIFESQMFVTECPMETPPPKKRPPGYPPPPPPPPPSPKTEHAYKVTEEMPRFPGCENKGLERAALRKCAEERLMAYIDSNLEYPCFAQEHGVKGMVLVRFVIEKDGRVTGAKVVRDIGAGCGRAALQMVEDMPDWVPGKQFGRAVRVQFNLPVRFLR